MSLASCIFGTKMDANTANTSDAGVPWYRAPKLTPEQTEHVIRMVRRGDRQMDVAFWFGVSPSTVNRIWQNFKKRRGGWTIDEINAMTPLPPPGPYQIVSRAELSETERRAAAATVIVEELQQLVQKYARKSP